MQVGTLVQFWDYDNEGEEHSFIGKVVTEFTDPEERHPRPSFQVELVDGSVKTPYVDECREAAR